MAYIVLGYGKFGRLAVKRLTAAFPEASVIVVEQDRDRIATPFPPQVTALHGDATDVLVSESLITAETIVIPMVPFHLAASFIKDRVQGCREIPLPKSLEAWVPNPFSLDPSTLCCSEANFCCPDDCPEGDRCTVTGLPRTALYSVLEVLRIPGFTVLVQRSHQILPGVGGYAFKELQSLTCRIVSGCYAVATSCKCHAIITGLDVS